MKRPVIGITVKELPAREAQDKRDTARSYVAEVERAGARARLVAPHENLRSVMKKIDGLLLSGGGDVNPEFFGARPDGSEPPDNARDRMEIAATKMAVRRAMPVLAICRGIQMLNVALGGDLIQDIPQRDTRECGPLNHRDPRNTLSHTIRIEPGSLLARLLRARQPKVNSRHHQAVGPRLGKGLLVTARSTDGIIEAVEMNGGRPVLGVQFHPENLVAKYPRYGVIFKWLAAQARRYRRLNDKS